MPPCKCWRSGASHLKGVGWGCSGDKAPGTCCAPASDQQHYLARASLVLLSQQATSGPEHPMSDGFSVEKVAFVEFLLLFLASFPNPFPRWKLVISGFCCILVIPKLDLLVSFSQRAGRSGCSSDPVHRLWEAAPTAWAGNSCQSTWNLQLASPASLSQCSSHHHHWHQSPSAW